MPHGESVEIHEAGVSLNLAELIFETRAGADMTQAELASAIGASHADVEAWEKGTDAPPVDVLARVAEACGKRLHISIEVD